MRALVSSLAIFALMFVSLSSMAQEFVSCPGPQAGLITVAPRHPTRDDVVMITVGANGYDPSVNGGAIAAVDGDVINITFTGLRVPISPNTRICAVVSVGRLREGNYRVNLLVDDPPTFGPTPRVYGTSNFSVTQMPLKCVQPSNSRALIAFNPSGPNESQTIEITTGDIYYPANNVVASVEGQTINITLTGRRFIVGLPPPLSCATLFIGPLAAGTYSANLRIVDVDRHEASPGVVATGTLIVARPPELVPSLSPLGIAALGFALSFAGGLLLRRRS